MDFSSIDQQSADHFQGKEDKEEEKEHKDDKLVINNNNTLKESAEPRKCWVCYVTEGDADECDADEWVSPCRCVGSTKYVHQNCLQVWIDVQQRQKRGKICCSQCKTEYVLIVPKFPLLANILECVDDFLYRFSPIGLGTFALVGVYWLALSYGALTVFVVVGCDGRAVLEDMNWDVIVFCLPCIPIGLVLGKLIQWEDKVLHCWRSQYDRIPIFRLLQMPAPPINCRPESEKLLRTSNSYSSTLETTRKVCSALLLPSISALIGKCLFNGVQSGLKRTLLGGLTFIAVKGICKIYLRQQQFLQHTRRKAVGHDDYYGHICNQLSNMLKSVPNDHEQLIMDSDGSATTINSDLNSIEIQSDSDEQI